MADLLPGGFQLETQIPTPPVTTAPARKSALRKPTRSRRGKRGSA
jgi:hypothetical protein